MTSSTPQLYETITRVLPPAYVAMWDAAEIQAVLQDDGRVVLQGERETLRTIVATSGATLTRALIAAGFGVTAVVVVDDDGHPTELDPAAGDVPAAAAVPDRDVTPGEAWAALQRAAPFRMPTARCHHPMVDVNDARAYSPGLPLTFHGYPGRAFCDYTRTRLTVRVELAIAQVLGVCGVRDGRALTSLNMLGWATWGRKMARDEAARLVDELFSLASGALRYSDVRTPERRPGEPQPAFAARSRAFRRAHEVDGPIVADVELLDANGEWVGLQDLYDPAAPTRLRRPLSNCAQTVRLTPSVDLAAAVTAPGTQLGGLFTLVDAAAVHLQSRSTPAYLRALAAPQRPDGGRDARRFGLLSAGELAEWGEQRAYVANTDRRVNRALRREAIDRIAEDLGEVCRTAPARFERVNEETAAADWRIVELRIVRERARPRAALQERPRARYVHRRRGDQATPVLRASAASWVRQARLRGDTPQRARMDMAQPGPTRAPARPLDDAASPP